MSIPWLGSGDPFPPVEQALMEPNGLLAAGGDLSPERLLDAYARLADLGYAHSVEAWDGDELAGGLYGVALGRVFYGESMFSRRSNASKVALAYLARQLDRWSFVVIDCQLATGHLASLGAREIARGDFLRHLRTGVAQPGVAAPWRIDDDLMTGL